MTMKRTEESLNEAALEAYNALGNFLSVWSEHISYERRKEYTAIRDALGRMALDTLGIPVSLRRLGVQRRK